MEKTDIFQYISPLYSLGFNIQLGVCSLSNTHFIEYASKINLFEALLSLISFGFIFFDSNIKFLINDLFSKSFLNINLSPEKK